MQNNIKQSLAYFPLAFSLLLFVIFRHFFFSQTGDDSYIYFRYIDRALAGKWWSWSDHISPVEGYSSPLWYGLLVITAKLGVPVILAARIWGCIFAFLTVSGTWYLSRELKSSVVASGVACLLLVSNHGFNYWAASGLETSLYAALLVWSCIGIVRERFWLLPTSLIGIARPEGLFLLVAILACMFVFKRRNFSVAGLVLCVLPAIVWLLARLHIYGDWLPNTFYAKATGELQEQLFKGALYCLPVICPLLMAWVFWLQERNKPVMIALGIVTMLSAIVLLGGGDWMFHFRLLVPLLALLLAVGASYWSSFVVWKKTLLAISFIPLLALSIPPRYMLPAMQWQVLPELDYQEGTMTKQSIALAKIIADRYPAPQLVAVNHAGALPWAMPEYNVIDMVGLNDAHIARAKGRMHHKYDVDYVLGQKPDLIILNSRIRPGKQGVWYHKGYWPGEDALVSHPDFSRWYEATDLVAEWHWQVPFPYTLVVKNAATSWIMVYRRKPWDLQPAP